MKAFEYKITSKYDDKTKEYVFKIKEEVQKSKKSKLQNFLKFVFPCIFKKT